MTNYIHDFPLHVVTGFQWSNKEVRIEGYEIDRGKLDSLRTLFSRAAWNVIYKERPAGPSYVMDLTSDQRNMRVCNFSTEELISGWYALKSISYSPRKGRIDYFPYRITLIYIGTLSRHQRWYALQIIASITNDWGL